MADSEKQQTLKELFDAAAEAHHRAYSDVDGADPDWPLWYADYVHERLAVILEARLTRSELVYLLVALDREVQREAPGANWQSYYARALVQRYG
jgi:hypothetical protein